MSRNEIELPSGATDARIALLDCNNFYASCERVFNPRLRNRPIVVLSNNDGCIVARSNEAKELEIGMGEPFYKYRQVIERNKVVVLSSNYTLYGDMSRRVMNILGQYSPEVEIYSIDEAFFDLEGCYGLADSATLDEYGSRIVDDVRKQTGIPVSIGISTTKTLAKAANKLAKKRYGAGGICDLTDPKVRDKGLESIYVWELWGIGRKHGERLARQRIVTAAQLQKYSEPIIQRQMGVLGSRLLKELNGVSCLPLSFMRAARKSILSSRSFGHRVESLNDLSEAVAAYMTEAAGKLRGQNSVAQRGSVFLMTSLHNKSEKYYSNSAMFNLPEATNDTSVLIEYALAGLRRIFKPGLRYKKAGVTLGDLVPDDEAQTDLFGGRSNPRKQQLLETIDQVNSMQGKRTLHFAAQGGSQPWQMKCELCSPRYTTMWSDLPHVSVG